MTWSRLERCGSTLAFMMSLPRYGIKAAEEMVVLAIRVSLVVSGWSISLGVGHPWMLGNENVWCHHCNFWSKSVKLEFLHRIDWVRDLIETELLKCLSFVRLQDLVVGKKIVPPATWNATPTPPYTKQYIMQRAKLRRAKPVYNKQVSVVPWLFETNKLCLARLPFRPCSCQNAWVLGCLLTGAALRFILFVFEKFTGNKKHVRFNLLCWDTQNACHMLPTAPLTAWVVAWPTAWLGPGWPFGRCLSESDLEYQDSKCERTFHLVVNPLPSECLTQKK